MKERPIIFSALMVKAILEGRKNQTRRLVKLPPAPNHLGEWEQSTVGGKGTYLDKAMTKPAPEMVCIWHTRTGEVICCPFGSPGDHLWVKETFADFPFSGSDIIYRADDNQPRYKGKWKSGRFMPRKYSRITLKITDIGVERLQDISEEDAKAEGIVAVEPGQIFFEFIELWESIHGKGSWDINPWIWRIEFKKT